MMPASSFVPMSRTPPTPAAGKELPHLLLVEDNEPVRTMLSAALRHAGYHVVTAAGGTRALALCATRRPDVVLIDLELSDMNGLQLCHCLRDQWAAAPIPVVFMSACPDDLMNRLLADLSYARFLSKPVHPKLLLEALAAVRNGTA
jgi:DNA-binding response OmpR family regulator